VLPPRREITEGDLAGRQVEPGALSRIEPVRLAKLDARFLGVTTLRRSATSEEQRLGGGLAAGVEVGAQGERREQRDMAPGTISSLKGAAPGQIRLDTLLRLSWFFSHKLGRLITPDDILRYVPPPELKSDMNTR
jgi:hypothetical protein